MAPIVLRFLRFHCLDRHHCAVQYHQLIDGIIRRFEDTHPTVRIESTVMRNWYQLMYTLNKKLPEDDGPDVYHTCGGGELEDLAARGLAYDLSRDLDGGWREDFVPAAWHPLRFRGREYAVPLEQGFVFVWYNKRIFEKFNLLPPSSFDELLSICRRLRAGGIIPFSAGNKERWPGAFFFSHLFHRIGGEAVFVPDFTRVPNYADIRDSFLAAGEGVLQLSDAGAFHEDCDTTDYVGQRLMFAREEAAMQLNGNRLLSYLKVEGPGLLDHVGIFAFPVVRDGKGTPATIFGGSLATYGVSARSANKPAVLEFLRSLTDRQAAMDVIHGMGDVPAMRFVQSQEYPSAIHGELASLLGRAERVQVHFFKYLAPHPAGVYLNSVAALLRRDISPRGAFTQLEEALQRALSKRSEQWGQK